ncbi:hypothetical protein AB4140_08875 [Shewanella sp. 10N.286.51.B2]|uniref:hypothetical protein n=1 Tax=Shewanella sp. 10N.286.51.B2 TaxID=3229707 RepID=UPI00354FD808
MSKNISKLGSVNACEALLQNMIENPSAYDSFNVSLLNSQKALSSMEMPERGITSMSLNRWKHYADKALPGGWRCLDRLRKQAYKALSKSKESHNYPSRGTISDYKQRLKNSQSDNAQLINEIARFGEQYTHLLEFCHIRSRQDKSFKALFESHLDRYSSPKESIRLVESGKY